MSAHEILMAFPSEQHETQDGLWNQTFDPGMTLRDWFAGQALAGLIGSAPPEAIADITQGIRAGGPLAYGAYALADAMLKARAS